MKVLFWYTLSTIRQNKRTSLSIFISVLLASTLLCSMCTFVYTQMKWNVEIEEYESGQWHGELGGEIPADRMPVVDNNLYVEASMVKGPFTCLRLPEESALPYLLLRDADENYWNLMGEKNALIEGRIPQKPGEIAVSKSFFEHNPMYSLGDTLEIPMGERWLEGSPLEAAQVRKEGEEFHQSGEAVVTLVGKMDLTTNTTVPGYYAMGYMDRKALTGQEKLVVYVKLKDIRKTYEVLPRIAESLGIPKDEYGEYENHFGYHGRLLLMNLVFPPGTVITLKSLWQALIYGGILLLVMGAFATIICGAFQVSAGARMRQLGMFRSIGATPGQIAGSVLMEGGILSIVPVLLSLGIGYGFTVVVIKIYTDLAGEFLYFPITVRFSFPVALLSSCCSLLTVLGAALIPARKMAKLTPLEAIRMQENEKGRKIKGKRKVDGVFFRTGLGGYETVLANASHRANKRSFRAGVLSLTFSLMLPVGFFSLLRLNDYLSVRNRQGEAFNIYTRLEIAQEADTAFLEELEAVAGVEESTYFCVARTAYWASPREETEAFKEQGGFAGLDPKRWGLINRDGKYRIRVYLYGMQEERFDAYARGLGEDPSRFYDTERIKAVAWSAAPLYPEVVNDARKSAQSYSHLTLLPGQELMLEEKTEDSMETDYSFPIEAGAVAKEGPRLGDIRNNYTINLYLPLSVYYCVIQNFSGEKTGNYYTYLKVKTAPEDDIAVTDTITRMCESVMASEDLVIISRAKEEESNAAMTRAVGAVINCIGLLLGMIGISNTLSAVSHMMMRRRREFAMLRSVGMDTEGVGRLLSLEGIRMAVTPVLIMLPAVAVLLHMLMGIVEVSWPDFLPWMPWGKIFLSIAAVMTAAALSYRFCAGRIKKDTIIEAIRDENV